MSLWSPKVQPFHLSEKRKNDESFRHEQWGRKSVFTSLPQRPFALLPSHLQPALVLLLPAQQMSSPAELTQHPAHKGKRWNQSWMIHNREENYNFWKSCITLLLPDVSRNNDPQITRLRGLNCHCIAHWMITFIQSKYQLKTIGFKMAIQSNMPLSSFNVFFHLPSHTCNHLRWKRVLFKVTFSMQFS